MVYFLPKYLIKLRRFINEHKLKLLGFLEIQMRKKKFSQSDFMSLQLMEIEKFRMTLSQRSQEPITFQEAVLLWITEGYAEEFRTEYFLNNNKIEPDLA